MKKGTAPGPDGVPSEAMRILIELIPNEIKTIMNDLLIEKDFPVVWKVARVTLIWKQGKPIEENSSFRPICLLSEIGKFYETLIRNRIVEDLDNGNKLSNRQYGFRKGRSTLHAIKWIQEHQEKTKRKWKMLVALDVKNAFNSASWKLFIRAMKRKNIPGYLIAIVETYLNERKITWGKGQEKLMSVDVPQGSVLGPTLWNILYDDVLNIEFEDEETKTIAYADDLALYVEANNLNSLMQAGSRALQKIQEWMEEHNLFLATPKTEMVILKGSRKGRDDIRLSIGGEELRPKKSLKYLGIHLDSGGYFGEHVKAATSKAEDRITKLAKIMPNIGGPSHIRRRLLYGVVQSTIVYGAPIWYKPIKIQRYQDMITKVQRRTLIRVCSAYRTVSAAAVQVIAGTLPIEIIINEQRELFESGRGHTAEKKIEVRESSIAKWQTKWENNEITAQWLKKLIPNIKPWINCKFKKTNYFFTQFLTGHGSYKAYTFKIKKVTTTYVDTALNLTQ